MTSNTEAKKLSILHIVAAPASGGAETFVKDLTCCLSDSGLKMHIAFLDRASDLGRDPDFETKYLDQLDRHGVSYSFLGHECRRRPWLGAHRLRRIVKELDIDIIHSNLAYGNIFALGVPKTTLVYTHHSENARFPKFIWAYFGIRASHFIGISKACSANLRNYAGRSAEITTIINAVDLDGIPVRTSRQGDTKKRAISVGRITEVKNYPLLAKALVAFNAKSGRELTVDIFGEGDQNIADNCTNILEEAGLPADSMRFLGICSNVRKILKEYDLFLMSSDTEGLPIALIEATAAGLPAVVTNVGGCSEVVIDGRSGIVVPAGDAAALGDGIYKLLGDPNLLEEYSREAQKTSQSYSIAHASKAHERIYSNAVPRI